MNLSLESRFRPFIVSLICSILEGSAVVRGQAAIDQSSASRPTPKARPRPRVSIATNAKVEPSRVSESSVSRDSYSLPTLDTVLRHLSSSSVSPRFQLGSLEQDEKPSSIEHVELDAQKSAIAKTHLLQTLEQMLGSASSTDNALLSRRQWVHAIRERKIRKAVETGFSYTAGLSDDSLLRSIFISLCSSVVEDLEKSNVSPEEDPMEV